MAGGSIHFLTDNNVPDALGDWLIERGHDVLRVRDEMPPDSPDAIVAESAIQSGRVLISWDRDFNHQRFNQPRFAALLRIAFACPEPSAVARMIEAIEWVEDAYERSTDAKPMLVKIGVDRIMIRC